MKPYSCTTSATCPFGITDLGFGPSLYKYNTSAYLGTFNWTDLAFQNTTTIGNDSGDPIFIDQLNLVLNFTVGGTTYAYWVQDMFAMNSGTNSSSYWSNWTNGTCPKPTPGQHAPNIIFFDNMWNFTNLTSFPNDTGRGHGHVDCINWGVNVDPHCKFRKCVESWSCEGPVLAGASQSTYYPGTYYFYESVANPLLPGNCAYVNPNAAGNIQLKASSALNEVYNATLQEWNIVPGVTMQYSDPGTGGQFVTFDSFNFTFAYAPGYDANFTTSGQSVPAGWWLYYEAENIIGGDGGGATTDALPGTSFEMSLQKWDGHNFQTVPSAWNYASDTGEKVTGLSDTLGDQGGLPVGYLAYSTAGGNQLHNLYFANSLINSIGYLDIGTPSLPTKTLSTGTGTSPEYSAVDENGNLWVTDSAANNVKVFNGATGALLHTLATGTQPRGIVADQSHQMYVANFGSGRVSVFNTTTYTLKTTINLGTGSDPNLLAYVPPYAPPSPVYLHPGIYVTEFRADAIAYIDDVTNTVAARAHVGSGPSGIAYANNSHTLWVTNFYSNNVSALTATPGHLLAVVANVGVGKGPIDDAWSNSLLFVTNYYYGTVTVLNTLSLGVVATTPVGVQPWGIAYYPHYNQFFVGLHGLNYVVALNATTGAVVGPGTGSWITVGSGPAGLFYDNLTGLMVVANRGGNSVSLLSGFYDAFQAAVPSGSYFGSGNPTGMLYVPARGELYVAFTKYILVVNPSLDRIVQSIYIGNDRPNPLPLDMAYDDHNGYLYVTESIGSVAIVNTSSNTLVKYLNGFNNPWGVAYDSHNLCVYVVNRGYTGGPPTNLTVINGTAIFANVSIPMFDYGITYDSFNHDIYLVGGLLPPPAPDIGLLQVISGTAFVGSTPAGAFPVPIAFDPANGRLYVGDSYGGTTLVFQPGLSGTVPYQLSTIVAGGGASAIGYDPTTRNMYVVNQATMTVSVISSASNAVLENFPDYVGGYDESITFDSQDGEIFQDGGGSIMAHILSPMDTLLEGVATVKAPLLPAAHVDFVDGDVNIGLLENNYTTHTRTSNRVYTNLNVCDVKDGYTLFAKAEPNGCAAGAYSGPPTPPPSVLPVTSVPVGTYPWGLYVDPHTHVAFVQNAGNSDPNDTLVEVSLVTDSVIHTIHTNLFEPRGVWYDSRTGYVWVAGGQSGMVAVYNASSGSLVASIATGGGATPLGLAFDPVHNAVWVSDFEAPYVTEINVSSFAVMASITTGAGSYPYYITMDPSTGLVLVTDSAANSNRVIVIDSRSQTVIGNVSVPTTPYAQVAVGAPGMIVVTATGSSSVSEFSESNLGVVKSIAGPIGAWGVAHDSQIGVVAVGGQNGNTVAFYCAARLSSIQLAAPVSVSGPYSLAFDPSLNLLAVDAVGTGTLKIFDVSQLVGQCPAPMIASGPTTVPVLAPSGIGASCASPELQLPTRAKHCDTLVGH